MSQRFFVIFFLLVSAFPISTRAEQIYGTPAITPNGDLILEGHEIQLWGISPLASDQQCWRGNVAWNCGQQAQNALTVFTAGHLVQCEVKDYAADNLALAQCFRVGGAQPEDIAEYLVDQGLALDVPDASGGLYASDENDAWQNGRGVWTSRFQTADDWRNHVARYVDYQPAPVAIVNTAPPLVVQTVYVPFVAEPTPSFVVVKDAHDHDDHGDQNLHNAHPMPANTAPNGAVNPFKVGVPQGTFPVGAQPPTHDRNDNQ